MDTQIQFQKNAVVLTADGQQVGSLSRIVVNPKAMTLSDIVVRTGTLFSHEERVVPIEFVAITPEDQIVLNEEVGALDTFPAFEEEHIVDIEEDINKTLSDKKVLQPVLYGSPNFAMPLTLADEKFATRVDQNIPEGTVAMKEGAKVISADGKHVGNVERVFTEVSDEQITHLLISRGKVKKKTKLVPVQWVKDMTEEKINLRVQKASVDSLPDSPILV